MSTPWVSKVEDSLRECISRADEVLSRRDSVREELIKTGREVVRVSGYVITNIHAGRLSEADASLGRLVECFNRLREALKNQPCYEYSNLVIDYLSEYVEAVTFYNLTKNKKLVTPEELGVDHVPYIVGLLDLIGELKRYVLNLLSENLINEAQEFFSVMEVIYEHLHHLDYPDAILPNVRRRIDVARGVIESLRTFIVDIRLRNRSRKESPTSQD
ncbi:MAG: haloacid dehalogenase [Zestosphaera sp.]